MKRKFKLTFIVEFDDGPSQNDTEQEVEDPDPPIDPIQYMKDRADAIAEGVDDVLENYDFITGTPTIEEI